jgi:hypothetical protein
MRGSLTSGALREGYLLPESRDHLPLGRAVNPVRGHPMANRGRQPTEQGLTFISGPEGAGGTLERFSGHLRGRNLRTGSVPWVRTRDHG